MHHANHLPPHRLDTNDVQKLCYGNCKYHKVKEEVYSPKTAEERQLFRLQGLRSELETIEREL